MPQEGISQARKHWIEEALESENHGRESKWTESIAVGSPAEAGLKLQTMASFRARSVFPAQTYSHPTI